MKKLNKKVEGHHIVPPKVKLYRCDPDKNIYCAKTNCYRNNNGDFCHKTHVKKFRMSNIFKRIREGIKWKILTK